MSHRNSVFADTMSGQQILTRMQSKMFEEQFTISANVWNVSNHF